MKPMRIYTNVIPTGSPETCTVFFAVVWYYTYAKRRGMTWRFFEMLRASPVIAFKKCSGKRPNPHSAKQFYVVNPVDAMRR